MPLFGEIVEPSSRALCDFEELETSPTDEFNWETSVSVPKKIALLLCIDGIQGVQLFQKSVIPQSKLVSRCSTLGVSIYATSSADQYICLFEKSSLMDSEIVEALSSWIQAAENVIIIQTCNMIKFQSCSNAERPPCVIRALYNLTEKKLNIRQLEQPNIIEGIAAGVMSFLVNLRKPSALFVCYLDSQILDSSTAKPILEVLKSFHIPHTPYSSRSTSLNSQLYM